MKDKAEHARIQNESNQRRRKEWLAEHGPCAECGSWELPEVDHLDKETKITHRIWSYCKAKRDAELAKCRVLCRACHAKRHAEERTQHGTRTRYKKGCRCRPCVLAYRIAVISYELAQLTQEQASVGL